jgi:hypothetical protein
VYSGGEYSEVLYPKPEPPKPKPPDPTEARDWALTGVYWTVCCGALMSWFVGWRGLLATLFVALVGAILVLIVGRIWEDRRR